MYRIHRRAKGYSHTLIGHTFDPNRDIVLVTGGALGLGKEVALRFAEKKAKVAVLDIVVPPPAEQLAGVSYYQCDVSDSSEVAACHLQIKHDIGPVTVLVNNAGVVKGVSVVDSSFEDIERIIRVNLFSNFYTVKVCLPDMLQQQRGYIVTIGLVLGYMLPARLSAYGASKSGLVALHESLTYEIGPPLATPRGVKTLLVCPGQMKTSMFRGVKTPSTLFAPELDPVHVARKIVDALELGCRGEMKLPLYSNFVPFFRGFPWPVTEIARRYLGIDTSVRSGDVGAE